MNQNNQTPTNHLTYFKMMSWAAMLASFVAMLRGYDPHPFVTCVLWLIMIIAGSTPPSGPPAMTSD